MLHCNTGSEKSMGDVLIASFLQVFEEPGDLCLRWEVLIHVGKSQNGSVPHLHVSCRWFLTMNLNFPWVLSLHRYVSSQKQILLIRVCYLSLFLGIMSHHRHIDDTCCLETLSCPVDRSSEVFSVRIILLTIDSDDATRCANGSRSVRVHFVHSSFRLRPYITGIPSSVS